MSMSNTDTDIDNRLANIAYRAAFSGASHALYQAGAVVTAVYLVYVCAGVLVQIIRSHKKEA